MLNTYQKLQGSPKGAWELEDPHRELPVAHSSLVSQGLPYSSTVYLTSHAFSPWCIGPHPSAFFLPVMLCFFGSPS